MHGDPIDLRRRSRELTLPHTSEWAIKCWKDNALSSITGRARKALPGRGFDDFIFMSAPRYYRGANTTEQRETDAVTALGVEMVQTSPPGAPISMSAKFGPVLRQILSAMAPAVRTLIDHGNPVIFDHVLHDRAMYESYLQASSGLDVFTVGVTCPLDILEMRERARGDRVLGRARGLAEVVHTFCSYDTVVDTGAMSTEGCVRQVVSAMASAS